MKNLTKYLVILLTIIIILVGYFFFHRESEKSDKEKNIYSCSMKPEYKKYRALEGERLEIDLKIINTGSHVWNSQIKNPFLLSYHLLDEKGNTLRYDNRRYPLPSKLEPSQSLDIEVILSAPLKTGTYTLEFDLLREGLAWFEQYGSKTLKIPLKVNPRKWNEDKHDLNLEYGTFTKYNSSVKEINKIFELIRITLDENAVEFKGKSGKIYGFSGGMNYPQIWIRDSNTFIPASRYFYDRNFHCSWIEEHLFHQKKNGSLYDWIDSKNLHDKNTTETDQESSLVQAAYQTFNLVGNKWLRKKIKDIRIIDRLENALLFVLDSRFNKEYGLLTGAHTADWGDVDMVDSDSSSIYTDDRTHWTVDIYDQAMFVQACYSLASLFESLSEKRKAIFWGKKAELIKQNTNELLWNDRKGFYKVHQHLDLLKHDFEESDIFAMGGNTQAILSGIAPEYKTQKIIREAMKRQQLYNISTISGTLLPPYPEDTFKHPLMDDPFEYQNGAQWDWFGGRLVLAMFKNGFSSMAKEKLIEIIRKNLANGTFYEWDNKEGVGCGSAYFTGSAGILGQAVFEGYFGIELAYNNLTLS
ncbi:MAG: hypothetical protein ACOC5F_05425, partial [Candidatus Aminicenantaceae bacterium]